MDKTEEYESLRKGIKSKGFAIDAIFKCEYLFNRFFSLKPEKRLINFVIVRAKQLGHKGEGHTYKNICESAKKIGLLLCPENAALLICRNSRSEDIRRNLVIASDPFQGPSPENKDLIFGLTPTGKEVLLHCVWASESMFHEKDSFIFVQE